MRHWLLQNVLFLVFPDRFEVSVNFCRFLRFPSVEIKSDDGYQIERRLSSVRATYTFWKWKVAKEENTNMPRS